MKNLKQLELGQVGLIVESTKGVHQIALTEERSKMLQIFLSSLSKNKPLIQLPSEYDLVLKSKKVI